MGVYLSVALAAALACNVRMYAPAMTVKIVPLLSRATDDIVCDSLNSEEEMWEIKMIIMVLDMEALWMPKLTWSKIHCAEYH